MPIFRLEDEPFFPGCQLGLTEATVVPTESTIDGSPARVAMREFVGAPLSAVKAVAEACLSVLDVNGPDSPTQSAGH